MTLPIERARTRRPITWLTLVGVILLPVPIGGILVAALSNPTERLDNISAAIVNNDKPVTIDGQLVPLGRQLTAGLIDGAGESADGEGAPRRATWAGSFLTARMPRPGSPMAPSTPSSPSRRTSQRRPPRRHTPTPQHRP